MELLIIGGSSFVGKNLIEQAPKDWKIKASYNNSKEDFLEFLKNHENVEPFHLDLTKENNLDLGEPDIVLYLAGVPPGRTEDIVPYQIHAYGVNQVADSIKSCKKFIYLSSGVFYLNKNNSPYRISRTLGEANVISNALHKKFNYIILRNMEMYGKYMAKHKLYRKLAEACLNKEPYFEITGTGNNFLDTMHNDDYTQALLKVITDENLKNEIIDFCKSEPVTIKQLAETIAKVFNNPEFKLICKEGSPTEDTRFKSNNQRMIKLLNFEPKITLEEGLKRWKETGLK